MKKVICFAIILASLFLVSCGNNAVPIDHTIPTTAATPSVKDGAGTSTTAGTAATSLAATASTTATSSTQGGTTPTESFISKGYGSSAANMRYIETKSKILFLGSMSGTNINVNPLYYYSKADGEIYPFCFNPLCQHDDGWIEERITCIGCAMNSPYAKPISNADPVYMNSRIYFVYLDTIYSCSEFATDLKIEFSFNEYSHFSYDEIMRRVINQYYPICDFHGYGSTLLFKHIDENGKIAQYKFDTKTKKATSLTEKISAASEKLGVSLYVTKFTNNKIFLEAYTNVKREPGIMGSFAVIGDFMGCYESDYELKELKKVDFRLPNITSFVTPNGLVYFKTINDKTGLFSITYDGKETVIFEDYEAELNCKSIQMVYLTDDAVYYYVNNPVEIGNDPSFSGKARENRSGGKIYRYDFKAREIKCIFDDLRYDYFEIKYIGEDDGTVLMTVQKYEKMSDTNVKTTGGVILKGSLDANGNFVDIEEVEFE